MLYCKRPLDARLARTGLPLPRTTLRRLREVVQPALEVERRRQGSLRRLIQVVRAVIPGLPLPREVERRRRGSVRRVRGCAQQRQTRARRRQTGERQPLGGGFIENLEVRRPPSPRTPPHRPGRSAGGGGPMPEVCGAAVLRTPRNPGFQDAVGSRIARNCTSS
jgi:hypothetical protein